MRLSRGMQNKARAVLAAAAVILIGAGVFRGEASLVFTKASNICMECIGIG